jgi:hypothetical protein
VTFLKRFSCLLLVEATFTTFASLRKYNSAGKNVPYLVSKVYAANKNNEKKETQQEIRRILPIC